MGKGGWNKTFKNWVVGEERSVYDLKFYEKSRIKPLQIQRLVNFINKNFSVDSIADLGCGQGDFLHHFEDTKRTLGIDFSIGAITGLLLRKENFLNHDLTTHFAVSPGQYDLVMSLETWEHIPEPFEKIYVDNIMALDPKYVMVSCARIDQKGRHHYNCNYPEHIIEVMTARGLQYDENLTARFQATKFLKMYTSNTHIFRKVY